MTAPDRWQRVEQLCQEALDRPEVERAPLLDAACGGDQSLRQEVEALLKHEAAGSAFLELPQAAVAAAAMEGPVRRLSGQRIGIFEIGPLLGVGGMGEVYRARDTDLDRDVALKVLPAHVAVDADRLARFAREARALGALNHPNIGAIFGFEKGSEIQALVLELVEGPTLADRLAHGPIPLDDARRIALQIAEGLEAAHEQGLVHRDLKPANIKLRADGVVKVLDFGLAKALEPTVNRAAVTGAPTVASPSLTGAGVLLGTPGYMSPEQAKGRPADTRADIWAFGAVLFEMLSGVRAFKGDEWADTLAAVLRSNPDWSALPADTPEALRRLLRRCLQKDPKQRVQHIGDARLELSDVDEIAPRVSLVARRQRVWPFVAAAVTVATVSGATAWMLAPRATEGPVRQFSIPVTQTRSDLALSPDGRLLVYVVGGERPGLVARALDGLSTEPIRGGERGIAPFFSPDGAWIGFFADGKLKRVPSAGGSAVTIADAPANGHGAWGDDGTIVVARPYLYRVPSTGGTLEQILGDGEGQFHDPALLPGSKVVLVQTRRAPDPGRIEAIDLETRARHPLVEGDAPTLTPTGDLLFRREGRIWAAKFDADRLAIVGDPIPALESLGRILSDGETMFASSKDGTLAYLAGDVAVSFEWRDRTGGSTPALPDSAALNNPRLSPDGKRVAGSLFTGSNLSPDVWTIDLERGSRLRMTTGGYNRGSVWSPDGAQLAIFSARLGEDQDLYVISSGGGEPRRILSRPGAQWPVSWSPDGRALVFEDGPGFSRDLWLLPFGEEPRPLAVTRFNERGGVFSPDGHWIAFVTDESGRAEVYAQPFPGPGPKVPISTNGGIQPVWSRDGRELFFREGDSLMSVSIRVDPFRASPARKLFDLPQGAYGRDPYAADYDVAADGRFLTVRQNATREIRVVLNWGQSLRRLLGR
jgi:eukaryotic-like serine/threonine-protein kinase